MNSEHLYFALDVYENSQFNEVPSQDETTSKEEAKQHINKIG